MLNAKGWPNVESRTSNNILWFINLSPYSVTFVERVGIKDVSSNCQEANVCAVLFSLGRMCHSSNKGSNCDRCKPDLIYCYYKTIRSKYVQDWILSVSRMQPSATKRHSHTNSVVIYSQPWALAVIEIL